MAEDWVTGLRLPRVLVERLDALVEDNPDGLSSRTQHLRQAVSDYLERQEPRVEKWRERAVTRR